LQAWEQEFGWYKGQRKPTMIWRIVEDSAVVQSLRNAILAKLRVVAYVFGYTLEPLRDQSFGVGFRPTIGLKFNAPAVISFPVEVNYDER
jgi:hypothetical protein